MAAPALLDCPKVFPYFFPLAGAQRRTALHMGAGNRRDGVTARASMHSRGRRLRNSHFVYGYPIDAFKLERYHI